MPEVSFLSNNTGKYRLVESTTRRVTTVDTHSDTHTAPVPGTLSPVRSSLGVVIIFRPWTFFRLPWLYRLYYPLCVSRRIDTWQIVYLSNKDPCPKISLKLHRLNSILTLFPSSLQVLLLTWDASYTLNSQNVFNSYFIYSCFGLTQSSGSKGRPSLG